jgi:IS1 family transposase
VYFRLHCSRNEFDRAAALSVEGVGIASIARVLRKAPNTVVRWLEKIAEVARRFNDETLRGFELKELQPGEIRTFLNTKSDATWIFTAIEVWSRLWPACRVGRRSYRSTHHVVNDVIGRSFFERPPLITADGFDYYLPVIRRLFAGGCVFGQVIKKRRSNRVVQIERRCAIGSRGRLAEALVESEDSENLNTSFVERLNLTIRSGTAYLRRRTTCHARDARQLEGQLEILRCHYNFMRPHRALRFGKVVRTPAMQAGLMKRKLSFRQVFLSVQMEGHQH